MADDIKTELCSSSDHAGQIEFLDPTEMEREERKNIREQERMRLLTKNNKGRILSLIVALLYIIFGIIVGGFGFLAVLLFLVMPVSLIWFSELIGSYTGSSFGFGGPIVKAIDSPTPAVFIRSIGWFLLLFPFIKALFIAIISTNP
jgi:uncharacterized membrane protein